VTSADYDILIAGGGINGAAIARDAAGRGARVLLVEQDDLAAHTSSASTKLIHGGLRYLEQYAFRLVRESLAERERLLAAAAHLIRPLQFAVPHDRAMRPAWMMRAGLWLYDMLGLGSSLPRSRALKLPGSIYGAPLRTDAEKGFLYWDCRGDDSRLVVACAQDAAARGARIAGYTRLVQARREGGLWRAELLGRDGTAETVTARALVNATGAWADRLLGAATAKATGNRLRLVKGSHIAVPRLFEGEHAYLLQQPDGRIVFAIPFERRFTLVGTTDVPWDGAPDRVEIDAAEAAYLCGAVNRWFARAIAPEDVVWRYAGVRALYDDAQANPSKISRDYVLAVDEADGAAPVLSVFGGKITTHRALAEHALDKLRAFLPELGPAWTGQAVLPGGDLGEAGLAGLIAALAKRAPFLDTATVDRLAHSYGSRSFDVVGDARTSGDLGEQFGAGLSEREVRYLIAHEWARSADDILWRRSKLGLHVSPDEARKLAIWLDAAQLPLG
jgi:glycerol-3-phosphate dehydrogenase